MKEKSSKQTPSVPTQVESPQFPDTKLPEPEENDSSETDTAAKNICQIFESGSVTTAGGKHIFHCLTIIGQIEGHYILPPQNKTTKYEHVIPQLVAIEQDPAIEGLLIILNTVGGDVEAGLAIAEAISGMSKPTVSLILGGGHSIGVPLAVSADHSYITHTASMIIHPVRMNGIVLGVPQSFDYLSRMQERINSFIVAHSSIENEILKKMLLNTTEMSCDIGSILYGKEAVEAGLIDQVGSLSEAISKLKSMINHT